MLVQDLSDGISLGSQTFKRRALVKEFPSPWDVKAVNQNSDGSASAATWKNIVQRYSDIEEGEDPNEAIVVTGRNMGAKLTRSGYLYNVRTMDVLPNKKKEQSTNSTLNRRGRRAAIRLFFVTSGGTSFTTSVLFRPYFLVEFRDTIGGLRIPEPEASMEEARKRIESLVRTQQGEGEVVEGESSVFDMDGPMDFSFVRRLDLGNPSYLRRQVMESKFPGELNHYHYCIFLRISFATERDLGYVKRILTSKIAENEAVIKVAARREEEAVRSGQLFDRGSKDFDALAKMTGEGDIASGQYNPLQSILDTLELAVVKDIREEGVPLVQRFLIDTKIRCGTWYNVQFWHPSTINANLTKETTRDELTSGVGLASAVLDEAVELRFVNWEGRRSYISSEHELSPGSAFIFREPDEVQARLPRLRVFAWDIEVTKPPLAFPDPANDEVMMISYMSTGRSGLIVNRSVVSEDIKTFEYTPAEEYPGFFNCYNVRDERQLLLTFFRHIQILDPHIQVTYNGDSFDFDYLWRRGKLHGIEMNDFIGYPSLRDSRLPDLADESITFMRGGKEFIGIHSVHVDCLYWVNRDSYLPMGSRGLKAVTKAKLRYDPRELDPELMTPYAKSHPQLLAEYSVCDALCTYYIYQKFIHTFILALSTIIPMEPDGILRRGSGTLCEALLMAQASENDVVFPNKHIEDFETYYNGFLLHSETYAGGKVDQLKAGCFRKDIPEIFKLDAELYRSIDQDVDNIISYWLQNEEGRGFERKDALNLDEVTADVRRRLGILAATEGSEHKTLPLIYHLDVGAMYPNIILTNRLQPTAMVSNSTCARCPWFDERNICGKRDDWMWRGEHFPLKRGDVMRLKEALGTNTYSGAMIRELYKKLAITARSAPLPEEASSDSSDGELNRNHIRLPKRLTFDELPVIVQQHLIVERAKDVSRVMTRKFKHSVVEKREAVTCQRSHSFYINTVHDFTERRVVYKKLKKQAENELEAAVTPEARNLAFDKTLLYESLQLAHKCILNSFYGYVMRKGARWHSMEMAAVCTYTGAQIIDQAFEFCRGLGIPLELDTDGIWTLLPSEFPQTYEINFLDNHTGMKTTRKLFFPCTMLNLQVHKKFTNNQYMSLKGSSDKNRTVSYSVKSNNTIYFEIDGPYKCMLLPQSEKQGQKLKKRYVVFDDDDRIVELKGFEIKRRGELELIKKFQHDVFPSFLRGSDKMSCYGAAIQVCSRWLDIIRTKGRAAKDPRLVMRLIKESKTLSKAVDMMGPVKGMGITTAKRLAEFFGDTVYLTTPKMKMEYVVSAEPANLERTSRAVPVQIFDCNERERMMWLKSWTGTEKGGDVRDFIDWEYYRGRLETTILKIVILPAMMEGIAVDTMDVQIPKWVVQALSQVTTRRLTTWLKAAVPITAEVVPDIEDLDFAKCTTGHKAAADHKVDRQQKKKDAAEALRSGDISMYHNLLRDIMDGVRTRILLRKLVERRVQGPVRQPLTRTIQLAGIRFPTKMFYGELEKRIREDGAASVTLLSLDEEAVEPRLGLYRALFSLDGTYFPVLVFGTYRLFLRLCGPVPVEAKVASADLFKRHREGSVAPARGTRLSAFMPQQPVSVVPKGHYPRYLDLPEGMGFSIVNVDKKTIKLPRKDMAMDINDHFIELRFYESDRRRIDAMLMDPCWCRKWNVRDAFYATKNTRLSILSEFLPRKRFDGINPLDLHDFPAPDGTREHALSIDYSRSRGHQRQMLDAVERLCYGKEWLGMGAKKALDVPMGSYDRVSVSVHFQKDHGGKGTRGICISVIEVFSRKSEDAMIAVLKDAARGLGGPLKSKRKKAGAPLFEMNKKSKQQIDFGQFSFEQNDFRGRYRAIYGGGSEYLRGEYRTYDLHEILQTPEGSLMEKHGKPLEVLPLDVVSTEEEALTRLTVWMDEAIFERRRQPVVDWTIFGVDGASLNGAADVGSFGLLKELIRHGQRTLQCPRSIVLYEDYVGPRDIFIRRLQNCEAQSVPSNEMKMVYIDADRGQLSFVRAALRISLASYLNNTEQLLTAEYLAEAVAMPLQSILNSIQAGCEINYGNMAQQLLSLATYRRLIANGTGIRLMSTQGTLGIGETPTAHGQAAADLQPLGSVLSKHVVVKPGIYRSCVVELDFGSNLENLALLHSEALLSKNDALDGENKKPQGAGSLVTVKKVADNSFDNTLTLRRSYINAFASILDEITSPAEYLFKRGDQDSIGYGLAKRWSEDVQMVIRAELGGSKRANFEFRDPSLPIELSRLTRMYMMELHQRISFLLKRKNELVHSSDGYDVWDLVLLSPHRLVIATPQLHPKVARLETNALLCEVREDPLFSKLYATRSSRFRGFIALDEHNCFGISVDRKNRDHQFYKDFHWPTSVTNVDRVAMKSRAIQWQSSVTDAISNPIGRWRLGALVPTIHARLLMLTVSELLIHPTQVDQRIAKYRKSKTLNVPLREIFNMESQLMRNSLELKVEFDVQKVSDKNVSIDLLCCVEEEDEQSLITMNSKSAAVSTKGYPRHLLIWKILTLLRSPETLLDLCNAAGPISSEIFLSQWTAVAATLNYTTRGRTLIENGLRGLKSLVSQIKILPGADEASQDENALLIERLMSVTLPSPETIFAGFCLAELGGKSQETKGRTFATEWGRFDVHATAELRAVDSVENSRPNIKTLSILFRIISCDPHWRKEGDRLRAPLLASLQAAGVLGEVGLDFRTTNSFDERFAVRLACPQCGLARHRHVLADLRLNPPRALIDGLYAEGLDEGNWPSGIQNTSMYTLPCLHCPSDLNLNDLDEAMSELLEEFVVTSSEDHLCERCSGINASRTRGETCRHCMGRYRSRRGSEETLVLLTGLEVLTLFIPSLSITAELLKLARGGILL